MRITRSFTIYVYTELLPQYILLYILYGKLLEDQYGGVNSKPRTDTVRHLILTKSLLFCYKRFDKEDTFLFTFKYYPLKAVSPDVLNNLRSPS